MSPGLRRRLDQPRTARPPSIQAATIPAPVHVSSSRESSRYAMVMPIVMGVSRICSTVILVTNGTRHSHPFAMAVRYVRYELRLQRTRCLTKARNVSGNIDSACAVLWCTVR